MFEVFGYFTVRLYGFGWLWGERSFRDLQSEAAEQGRSVSMYLFGNGSSLFWIGLLSVVLHAGLLTWLLL